MPSTRLVSLKLQGVRSFVDLTEIQFPPSGIVLLSGTNRDTGGSSGSGKSSVVTAIAWALGFCPFSATDMQSWQVKKGCSVTLTLSTDAGEVSITRGKKLQLEVAGVPFKGSSEQAEAEIDRILGLSAEMRALLTYRGQRKPGLFLNKTDLQKKEFLMTLLGLDRFEAALEASAEKIRALDVKVGLLRTAYEQTAAGVAEGESVLEPIDKHLAAVTLAQDALSHERTMKSNLEADYKTSKAEGEKLEREARTAFDDRIAAAKADVAALVAPELPPLVSAETEEMGKRADDARARIKKLVDADEVLKRDTERKHQALNREIQTQKVAAGAAAGLLREADRLHNEMVSLAAAICPTCEREWTESQEKQASLAAEIVAVQTKFEAARACEAKAAELAAALEALPPFVSNPTIERLREIEAKLRAEISGEVTRLRQQRGVLEAQFDSKKSQAQAAVSALLLQQSQAGASVASGYKMMLEPVLEQIRKIDLDSLHHAVNVAQAEARRRQAVQDTFYRLVDERDKRMATWDAARIELEREKDFAALIGREGFLGSIFDEVLAEISEETNRILASVANTRHCTLRFVSESTTQKGAVQKKIVPIITVGEYEAPFESGLSGGMQSAVELAVDLAVGAVISQRSGACPGWLILDESLDGLGPVEKESCFEILNTFARDRLILLIDHASELKAMVSHRIDIEFSGGKSRVVSL